MSRLACCLLAFVLAASAATLTDDQLFSPLALARPGLQPVASAVAQHDTAAARQALARYYRHRQKPVY